jgi:hypothetical protein
MGVMFDRERLVKDLTDKGVRIDPNSLDYGFVTWVTSDFQSFFSIEEAMRSQVFSEAIKMSLLEVSMMAENILPKNAATDLMNIILEYPKVIISAGDKPLTTDKYNELTSLGSIRLPFPRITTIDIATEFASAGGFTHTFMRQSGDIVEVLIFLSDKKYAQGRIRTDYEEYEGFVPLSFSLRIEDGKVMITLGSPTKGDIPVPDVGLVNTLIDRTLYAIHKMTLSQSDAEYYVSKPTPREIQVNKKKLSKRKRPTIEFRLIKLDGYKPQLPTLPQGTHASPRQHWRRGHWRNLASGKRVFVKPMLVGDEKNGKIIKDYIVEEPAHAH